MKYRRTRPVGEESIRRRRSVAMLPTLFTLGNCLFGFAAIHYAALGDKNLNVPVSQFTLAGYCIFAAMLCDMLDGRMARLAKATSDFGGELDSLADMVSFGVAPAFMALRLVAQMTNSVGLLGPESEHLFGKLSWLFAAVYVSCTALRLARFNVHNQHSDDAHMAFRGLPSPGAAGVIASSIIFFGTLQPKAHHILWFRLPDGVCDFLITSFPWVLPLLLLVTGMLMVSRFSYAHVVNQYLRGQRSFVYVSRASVVLLLAFWQPQIAALAAIYIYALSAPATWAYRALFRRSETPPASQPPISAGPNG